MNLPEHRERKYKLITSNKKANFNYTIIQKLEVGLELQGTEVKSIRGGKISLQDSYCKFINKNDNELFVFNMNIPPFEFGNINNHEPKRRRKILMKSFQSAKFRSEVNEKGYTIVPTELYFSGHLIKLEIALVKPKKLFDKRDSLKERDNKREIDRALKTK